MQKHANIYIQFVYEMIRILKNKNHGQQRISSMTITYSFQAPHIFATLLAYPMGFVLRGKGETQGGVL